MTDHVELRTGIYRDSVTLMQISRAAEDVAGVEVALVAMATELNLDLLKSLGFDSPAVGPNDLVIAVRASDDVAVDGALRAVEGALSAAAPRSDLRDDVPPAHTVAAAATGEETLALLSVPGEHVLVEALDALRAGLNVMIFSDNVPVEHEILLKRIAAEHDLLVMGPDCGTAIVAGVGLGFANVVRPGPVGVVAASGTGAQHLTCLLDDAGVGISHVLGVGGRDLSAEVGAASAVRALAALDADPATELIVLLSKPPDREVADRVREAARACATPVVTGFIGPGLADLTALATRVLEQLGVPAVEPRSWPAPDTPRRPRSGALRGLFAGGTLLAEAMVIATDALGPVRSNVPLDPGWGLGEDLRADGHVMIDFGDDRLTRGRPHPMIDDVLRIERLREEAADPGTATVLLDVVLGHGANPDPAASLGPAIREARKAAEADGRDLAVVVSLCGAASDPQGRDRQAAALREAGASVHLSNAVAAREAVRLVGGGTP